MDLTFEIEIVRLHSEGRTPDLTLCCEIERVDLYWQLSKSHIQRDPGNFFQSIRPPKMFKILQCKDITVRV